MGKSLDGKELGKGIIQKKNGRYEARYVDRFGNRKSFSGIDLKKIRRDLNEAIYENNQEINIKARIKLDDWFEKWISIYKYSVLRENSKRHYRQIYMKHISPCLGKEYIDTISQLQIRTLIKELDNAGYQYETKNKVRIILQDMFNKAIVDEFVRKNPAKGISIKRPDTEVCVLSRDDQSLFFNCCKGTFYDNFFNVAISTGLRVGELAALRWEDIDFKEMIIHVKRTLVYQKYDLDTCKTFHFENPKTKTSIRDIPINKQCEASLKKQYLQKNVVKEKAPVCKKPEKEYLDLLFTTRFNTPLNSQIVSDAIKKIVDEINLTRDVSEEMESFTCHCFRHTFATRCFEVGIQPKTVQKYLGHATLQMTMDLYTFVFKEYMSAEMEKLDSISNLIENASENIAEEKYENTKTSSGKVVNYGDFLVV